MYRLPVTLLEPMFCPEQDPPECIVSTSQSSILLLSKRAPSNFYIPSLT
jgi:hypothetical protein